MLNNPKHLIQCTRQALFVKLHIDEWNSSIMKKNAYYKSMLYNILNLRYLPKKVKHINITWVNCTGKFTYVKHESAEFFPVQAIVPLQIIRKTNLIAIQPMNSLNIQ